MSAHCDRQTNEAGYDRQAEILQAGVAMSSSETVERFGSASAEFIKGYRGVDQATGETFAKGLSEISDYKVNADPSEGAKNLKQQAGFAAEVAATSRDNAENIINGAPQRTVRSDDLPQFGANHNVVDRVQLLDGQIIAGTEAQMKFVGNRDDLLSKIAREDGKFARYRGVKLDLPSEQYADAKAHCLEQANKRRINAQRAEEQGKPEAAAKLRREAANYDELGENVRDSGLTSEDALFYRKHPELATVRDIAATSHRAGVEAAKYGAVIGGSISVIKNIFAVVQDKQTLGDAALNVAGDVAKAGAMGYGTAFVGAAAKATMQQSSGAGMRALANTSAPAMVVNVCLALGSSVKRYINGDITEAQLLAEIGEKSTGMLASGMMAAVGQVLIPIPFVGAAIGGMVGYTLSSLFYQSACDAARGAALSGDRLARIQAIESSARARIAEEQSALDAFVASELPQLQRETRDLFHAVEVLGCDSTDALANAINNYAVLLGKQLQFASLVEFDDFMASEAPLVW